MDTGDAKFKEDFLETQSHEQIIDMLMAAAENGTLLKITILAEDGGQPKVQKLTPKELGNGYFVFTNKVGDVVTISLDKIKMIQLPEEGEPIEAEEIKEEE